MARHRLEDRRLRAILYFKGGAYDGGKKSAANNEKLPRHFVKVTSALTSLFLAISVKHLKSKPKVHRFRLPVK
jgi:hypothetical protein